MISNNTEVSAELPVMCPKYLPWMIWLAAATFYFYEFFLQVSPSVMAHDLMRAFSIDGRNLGMLAAIYFYSYAAMQIPAGLLLDFIGPRLLLTMATVICVFGSFLFGVSHLLWEAEFGRFLIGLGSAFAALSCFKLAANWFAVRRFGLVVGMTLAVGTLGAICAQAPLAILLEHLSWRGTMMLLSAIGLIIAAGIYWIVRDTPSVLYQKSSSSPLPSSAFSEGAQKLFHELKEIFKRPQNWYVAIYGGLMFAPTSAFGALWGVSFFMSKYNWDRALAASIISIFFLGWVIGGPILGAYSDRIGKRKPPMILSAVGSFVTISLIIYVSMPVWGMVICLFTFGVFSSGFLPAFSMMRENNPHEVSGTAFGFMNCLNMVGGAVLQPVIGKILDFYWDHQFYNGARFFAAHSYHIALSILPLCCFLAFLILPFIKETHCQVKKL